MGPQYEGEKVGKLLGQKRLKGMQMIHLKCPGTETHILNLYLKEKTEVIKNMSKLGVNIVNDVGCLMLQMMVARSVFIYREARVRPGKPIGKTE